MPRHIVEQVRRLPVSKTVLLSTIGAWLAFLGVIVLAVVIWIKTNPGSVLVTDQALLSLPVEQINSDATIELNSLTKNGNLPIVVNPADIGRDNPFVQY